MDAYYQALDFEPLEWASQRYELRVLILFPASKFFRALPPIVSHLRPAELPPDNDRMFHRSTAEPGKFTRYPEGCQRYR